MIKKNNLFPFFVLFVLACVNVRGQETPTTPPTAPKPSTNVQVFTSNGGSYLGVQMQEVTKDNFSKFGLREVRGVAIEKVAENSPATQAGLQNGDVIIKFDGEEVASVRKLQRLIGEVAPDHQAKITVLREGKERDFTITVGKRPGVTFQNGVVLNSMEMPRITMPSMPAMPRISVMPRMPAMPNGDTMVWNFAFGRSIGVGTSSLTKQLGEYFGIADGKGILVTSVNENSPAAKGGLKAGDVIIEADGKAVTNSMELMRVLNAKEKGSVALTIIRNKNRQTVNVEPEERKNRTVERKMTSGNFSVTPELAPLTITGFPIEIEM